MDYKTTRSVFVSLQLLKFKKRLVSLKETSVNNKFKFLARLALTSRSLIEILNQLNQSHALMIVFCPYLHLPVSERQRD